MSTPDLYLTYCADNNDIIQESVEVIRGTKYYYNLFNNDVSLNHVIELLKDSSNNKFASYTLQVDDDVVYKKGRCDWSNSIMSANSNGVNTRTKNIIDTLNTFHADSSITETVKCIHLKYDNKTYRCEESLVLFGKRYYVLHDVTSSNPSLPSTVTIS
jgi:hypothetical protein